MRVMRHPQLEFKFAGARLEHVCSYLKELAPHTRCIPSPADSVHSPPPLWGGVAGGGPSADHRTAPRRHSASKTRVNALKAPTLPTRGRVGPRSPLVLIPVTRTRFSIGAPIARAASLQGRNRYRF